MAEVVSVSELPIVVNMIVLISPAAYPIPLLRQASSESTAVSVVLVWC